MLSYLQFTFSCQPWWKPGHPSSCTDSIAHDGIMLPLSH